jgi:hypothetical protein
MSELAYQSVVEAVLAAVPEIPGVEDWQRGPNGEPLPYLVFELVVRPCAEHVLKDPNDSILKRIFSFFEGMACSTDREVVNLLYIGLLEPWVARPELLSRALPYMGRETKKLAHEVRTNRGRLKPGA